MSGDLVSAPTLGGPMAVSFAAKDSGGGVYRVVVTADGRDVVAAVVPDAAGRCVQVDPADAYSFKWPQPCSLDVRTSVTIDTAAIPEGTHSIGVVLEDAAGNRTPLSPPTPRTVVRRGTPNGPEGAVVKRAGRYTVTTSFAQRRPTLRGTLTANGAPVAGALLDALAKNRISRANWARSGTSGRAPRGGTASGSAAGRRGRCASRTSRSWATRTTPPSPRVSHRVRARVDFRAMTRHVGLRGRARYEPGYPFMLGVSRTTRVRVG